eukprot:COSAG01_NODE_1022_length_12069_cov_142.565581_4_plen_138_part_00
MEVGRGPSSLVAAAAAGRRRRRCHPGTFDDNIQMTVPIGQPQLSLVLTAPGHDRGLFYWTHPIPPFFFFFFFYHTLTLGLQRSTNPPTLATSGYVLEVVYGVVVYEWHVLGYHITHDNPCRFLIVLHNYRKLLRQWS